MALESSDSLVVAVCAFMGGLVAGLSMWAPIKRRLQWCMKASTWSVAAIKIMAAHLGAKLPDAPESPPPYDLTAEEVTKPGFKR